MKKVLFEILACPLCKSGVLPRSNQQELICRPCGLAYPVRDGIPVMLVDEARTLTVDERLNETENTTF